MAPSSKLKQTSMDSFLHQKPNPIAVAEPESPSTASAYEGIRRETIRRNQEFLRMLGIASATAASPKSNIHHASSRGSKPPPASSLPLRRSSRNKPPSPAAAAEDTAPDLPEPSFLNSSVFQYMCFCAETPLPPRSCLSKPSSLPVIGFRVVGKAFRDPSLSRIYSIDVCSSNRDRFLVAAGGHGGFISIYGGEWDASGDDSEGGMMMDPPLMSWKGSPSWISGVRFLEDNPMLLVSSSNDGAVVVWDVKKQPAFSSQSSSSSPLVVARSTGLHSGGVYAMDLRGCLMATASKDSSVGVSRLTPAGELVADRNITGHHSGVIRGICFGDKKEQLADCGADRRICVLDTRLPEPCTLTIESPHSTGVNTVEWNKSNNFLILSASKDSTLHLYDIRRPAEPVHTQLRGHVDSNTRRCSQIYRPCFVGGKTIATPGQGSRKISLYDVERGMLMSQGLIGYDANLVIFTGCEDHPRLWAAGGLVNQLALCR